MKRGAKRRDAPDRRMVPVDSAPLRQQAASECSRALAKLDRARAELRRFEQEDRPAFAAWLATKFGPLLTELRENARRISEQEDLIAAVESEMIWSDHSNPRKAYAAVMRQRENPRVDTDFEEEPGGDISTEERHELFEDFAESILGVNAKDLPPERYAKIFADFQASALGETPEPGQGEDRIKEIYRILVRRLHPDLRAGDDATVSAIWHEVQEAYEAHNLDRLETLLALTEAREQPASRDTPLSQLRRAIEELARAIKALHQSIREAKRNPAWGFCLPKHNRAPLETRLRREMERTLANQRWKLVDLKNTLRAGFGIHA